MEQQENIDLSEIRDIVIRRRWSFIVPAGAIFFLAVIVALALPPVLDDFFGGEVPGDLEEFFGEDFDPEAMFDEFLGGEIELGELPLLESPERLDECLALLQDG